MARFNNCVTNKYEQGTSPCGNCQRFKHDKCRPRLDGTLCSCSCGIAVLHRNRCNDELEMAKSAGMPAPTVRELMEPFYPMLSKGL